MSIKHKKIKIRNKEINKNSRQIQFQNEKGLKLLLQQKSKLLQQPYESIILVKSPPKKYKQQFSSNILKQQKISQLIEKIKKKNSQKKSTIKEIKNLIQELQNEIKIQQRISLKHDKLKSPYKEYNYRHQKSEKILSHNKHESENKGQLIKNKQIKSYRIQKSKAQKSKRGQKSQRIIDGIKKITKKHYSIEQNCMESFLMLRNSFIKMDGSQLLLNSFYNCNLKEMPKQILQENTATSTNALIDVAQKNTKKFYEVKQVIKIQKWWRSILLVKEKLNNNLCDQALEQYSSIENSQNQNQIIFSETISEEKSQINKNQQYDILELQQNAIRVQMSTYQQILSKLLQQQKISQTHYVQQLMRIESKLQMQFNEIDKIRIFLRQSEQKVQKILKKTKQDIALAKKIEEGQDINLLKIIFPQQNKRIQNLETNTEGESKITLFEKQQFYTEANTGTGINKNLIQDFKQKQNINIKIQRKIKQQLALQYQQTKFIDTSIIGIHKFLIKFLNFYLPQHKQYFLKIINMPYGYSIFQRIQALQGYMNEEANEDGILFGIEHIIDYHLLQSYYKYSNCTQITNFQKIHNRVIFDAFNQACNKFRPYYTIKGPPYPWSHQEKALTFYFIQESNIDEVIQKSQLQVMKWASVLCGVIIDQLQYQVNDKCCNGIENTIDRIQNGANKFLLQNRQERLNKTDKFTIQDQTVQWSLLDQYYTIVLFEIENILYCQLAQEICQQSKIYHFV